MMREAHIKFLKLFKKKEVKMDIDKLTVGELKEITKLACTMKSKGSNKTEDLGRQIVILQRGWVMVGLMKKTGYQCTLDDAAVIRKWGTTSGLPELADNGPLSGTVLEKTKQTIRFHYMTVIATLECSSKWKS